MDRILDNLSDPSWWFTAVFVAIIASVLAGFLKDYVNQLAKFLPERYRSWREGRENKRQALIEELANDPNLLLIENMKVTRILISFVGMTVIFTGLGIMLMLKPPNEYTSFLKIIDVSFGIFSNLAGYTAVTRILRVNRANRRYRALRSKVPPSVRP